MERHIILSKLDNIPNNITLARTVSYVVATESNQKVFTIPMENFDKNIHSFDIVVGTTWFDDVRYDIVGNTIVLKENEEGIDIGRKVTFIFRYIHRS